MNKTFIKYMDNTESIKGLAKISDVDISGDEFPDFVKRFISSRKATYFIGGEEQNSSDSNRSFSDLLALFRTIKPNLTAEELAYILIYKYGPASDNQLIYSFKCPGIRKIVFFDKLRSDGAYGHLKKHKNIKDRNIRCAFDKYGALGRDGLSYISILNMAEKHAKTLKKLNKVKK